MSDRYEEIIKQLRDTEPVLDNREELAAGIISKVKQARASTTRRVDVFTLVIRPAMSAAAVFLIGLFFYQQVNDSSQYDRGGFTSNEIKTKINLIDKEPGYKKEIAKKMDDCLHARATGTKSISKACTAKIFLMYKSLEIKESQLRKQRLQNWFNH